MSLITHDVHSAVTILLTGGIIGLPTETVYGLAALAENKEAVARVFSTKGRPTDHPLIIHLSPEADIDQWGHLTPHARTLADSFWPGPLTLLVRRTTRVPDWVTGGRNTVALRVPSHPVAQQLLREVNTGVVAPSANRFGKVSPTTAEHVAADLGDDVDLILDGGACSVGLESTIVECIDEEVRVLRPGSISVADIEGVLGRSVSPTQGESRAPGMLASHYAPRARVVLCDSLPAAQELFTEAGESGVKARIMWHDDIDDYAEHLYADLRAADSDGCSVVFAVVPSASGLGAAIRDRLQKAAHRA